MVTVNMHEAKSRLSELVAVALKGEEVWDWRFKDGPTSRIFSVTFDTQGRVLGTGTTDDTRETQGGS